MTSLITVKADFVSEVSEGQLVWSIIDGNKQSATLARVSNVTTTPHHKTRPTQKQVAVTFGRKRNQHNAIRRSLQTADGGGGNAIR